MNRSAKHLIPVGCIQIRDNVLESGNLTGVSENKATWAKDLNLSTEAEYIFFAGCGYQQMKYVEGMIHTIKNTEKIGFGMNKAVGVNKAFKKIGVNLTNMTAKIMAPKEDPYTPVLISAISVLRKLSIGVGYMHENEPCCGSPMYYSGFVGDYADQARKNCTLFKSLGIRKLIGIVPGCTSALKNVYPKYVADFDLEVEHILKVIANRLKQSRDKPRVKSHVKVTYHDPCQLSRYLKIIEEPRSIIRSIEGVEFVEPDAEQRGNWSTCCGGGGLEATQPALSERVGVRRVEELVKTGAQIILSNCPGCEMQLRVAARKLGADVEVCNLVKFLDEALE
jgi:fumarate reductase (CoM/CoB) subunit B